VKIQIEFNPAAVSEYRLIGYENRALKREDFNNDRVDAGDIGAGHTVTALYEIALAGNGGTRIDPLRYGRSESTVVPDDAPELAFLRMRYKQPGGETSELIEWPLSRAAVLDDIAAASDDLRFAAAVSAFGQILRGGRYTGGFGYGDVADLARAARGPDPFGYRGEFLSLVGLAEALDTARSARVGG
jgi:Ca-activated chloride channel family protein